VAHRRWLSRRRMPPVSGRSGTPAAAVRILGGRFRSFQLPVEYTAQSRAAALHLSLDQVHLIDYVTLQAGPQPAFSMTQVAPTVATFGKTSILDKLVAATVITSRCPA